MVSFVNTAMPKHVAAPNIADRRYRGEHRSAKAESTHAVARLSRYTARPNQIAEQRQRAKTVTAAVLAQRDISIRRARAHSRAAVITATMTIRYLPAARALPHKSGPEIAVHSANCSQPAGGWSYQVVVVGEFSPLGHGVGLGHIGAFVV